MLKTFDITLDLEKVLYTPATLLFSVSENDFNTVQLNFNILQDGSPFDLTGKIVELAIKKPSGLIVYQPADLTNAADGGASLLLSPQGILENGVYASEVYIRDGEKIAVTSPFYYSSRSAVMDEDTLQSVNDWSALKAALYSIDLKPIITAGYPTDTPKYVGQLAFDEINERVYIATDLSVTEWALLGGLGGGSAIAWDEILNIPATFPAEAHDHAIAEINGLDAALNSKAAAVDVYTKLETYNKAEVDTIVTEITEGGGTIVTDNLTSDSTINALSANQGRILNEKIGTKADADHDHVWTDIIDKPLAFPAEDHDHAIADITGLQTALDGKIDDNKIWTGTQAAYDGLVKDAATLYFITG